MALNKAAFKTRAITAFVFVVVMLAGLFINGYTFIALFAIIICGCAYETGKIIKLIKPATWFYYLPLALIYAAFPVFMIDLGFKGNLFTSEVTYQNLIKNYSALLPIAVILSIWINDTMAYLVGSFIGKTPLSKISPKKTWEGTIGGIILCIICIGVIGYFIPFAQQLLLKHWLIIAAICAIAGTLGDLLESKLKRLAGIKDSGNFMPGHGGFLDRFDSLLLAAPAVWLYVYFFVS